LPGLPEYRAIIDSLRDDIMQSLNNLNKYAPYALGALRIIAALLFMAHGTQKMFGFPEAQAAFSALPTLIKLAAIMEVVGGILMLIGLFTRPVAFLLSGQMAFAYFMGHASKSFFPALNGGDAAILFCFVFLYIFFAGAGAFAVDNKAKI
jgi:putative oxidoreductase